MIKPLLCRFPLAALMLAACSLFGALPALAQAPSASAPLPTEAFFRNRALGNPVLSPSGKKIAMVRPFPSGRMGLAIADVATPDKFVGVAQFPDADVLMVNWVNEQRLVFNQIDLQGNLRDQLGSGLYAVNADATDFVMLIQRPGIPCEARR